MSAPTIDALPSGAFLARFWVHFYGGLDFLAYFAAIRPRSSRAPSTRR